MFLFLLQHCSLVDRKDICHTKIHTTSPQQFSSGKEMLVLSFVWSKVQMISIWSNCCHCHPVISCLIQIQNGSAFLAWAGKEAIILAFFMQVNKC